MEKQRPTQGTSEPDLVSGVVTFHRERELAVPTLHAIGRTRRHAEACGLRMELVVTLDVSDAETAAAVRSHPAIRASDHIYRIDVRDLSLSRNYAIEKARGEYVAIFDGDDLFSENWVAAAVTQIERHGSHAIVHPQLMIAFGAWSAYWYQVDQADARFQPESFVAFNHWNACSVARRAVYRECPYVCARVGEAGFGFEDWHWNCETMARGYRHHVAAHTLRLERRKGAGSLNAAHQGQHAVIRPSRFFDPPQRGTGEQSGAAGESSIFSPAPAFRVQSTRPAAATLQGRKRLNAGTPGDIATVTRNNYRSAGLPLWTAAELQHLARLEPALAPMADRAQAVDEFVIPWDAVANAGRSYTALRRALPRRYATMAVLESLAASSRQMLQSLPQPLAVIELQPQASACAHRPVDCDCAVLNATDLSTQDQHDVLTRLVLQVAPGSVYLQRGHALLDAWRHSYGVALSSVTRLRALPVDQAPAVGTMEFDEEKTRG